MALGKLAFRNFFINYGTRLVEFASTFIVTIIIVRGLGPDLYGLYTAVLTYVGLFALVFSLGFEDLLNAKIPQDLENKERISFLFSSFSLLRVAILFLAGIILYLLAEPISRIIGDPAAEHYLRISIPFFFFANIKTLFAYFFTGLFRFGTLAIGKAFASIAQVIGVVIVF
ncbi:MAG: oligosaccharide flippase family protein, partial [bacterium]|nr:oligosaccharide flippase family protein [bacterium]